MGPPFRYRHPFGLLPKQGTVASATGPTWCRWLRSRSHHTTVHRKDFSGEVPTSGSSGLGG